MILDIVKDLHLDMKMLRQCNPLELELNINKYFLI